MPIKPRHKDCHNPHCPLANPPGHHLTLKGYWRIHQRGKWRNWYLHRWVLAQIAGNDPGDLIEIHHQDFDARNCCPLNLVWLDKSIHRAFDNSSLVGQKLRSGTRGLFQSRPSANAEIDRLVVEMLWADMQGRRKEWSAWKALEEMDPSRRQLGMFDSPE